MEQEKPISDDHYLCISFLAFFQLSADLVRYLFLLIFILSLVIYNELKRNDLFYLALSILLDFKGNCGVLKCDT